MRRLPDGEPEVQDGMSILCILRMSGLLPGCVTPVLVGTPKATFRASDRIASGAVSHLGDSTNPYGRAAFG